MYLNLSMNDRGLWGSSESGVQGFRVWRLIVFGLPWT